MSSGGVRDGNGAVAFSRRVYERLLVAYPGRFRELYGEEMADLFEEVCRERLARGGTSGLLRAWAGALADLVASSVVERGRFRMGFSVVRWCGALAVAGGLLVAVHGVVSPWILSGPGGRITMMTRVELLGLVGMLSLTGGMLGLVALIASGGEPQGRRVGRSRNLGVGRLSWTQRSAVAGFLSAVAAALAAVGLLVMHVLYGGLLIVDGPHGVAPGSPPETAVVASGTLSGLGLPAAAILLGIAVWRSGILGRWSALPVAVGTLTFLAPPAGWAAARAIWGFGPRGSTLLAEFVMFGMPQIAIGVGWMALGFVLAKREGAIEPPGLTRAPRGSGA